MKYAYQNEYLKRLAQMPSMVTTYQKGRLDGTYILPPVQYPDGEYFFKFYSGFILYMESLIIQS